MHTVWRWEAVSAGLLAEERHFLVDEVTGVADARFGAAAGAGTRHTRAGQRLSVGADDRQRNDALRCLGLARLDDWLEIDLDDPVRGLVIANLSHIAYVITLVPREQLQREWADIPPTYKVVKGSDRSSYRITLDDGSRVFIGAVLKVSTEPVVRSVKKNEAIGALKQAKIVKRRLQQSELPMVDDELVVERPPNRPRREAQPTKALLEYHGQRTK
jgi:hypothetical protein